MPAKKPAATDARAFWIVGAFDDGRTTIRHVGLLAQGATIADDSVLVAVFHMAPPLEEGSMPCHLLGWLDNLDEDELFLIEQEAKRQIGGGAWIGQYIVCPPIEEKEFKDGKSIVVRTRFSCAGFVAHCYDRAGHPLVQLKDLPGVYLEDLVAIWSEQAPQLRNERFRTRWCGLTGPEPWPILLPAHLFHAVSDDDGKQRPLPYAPQKKDWAFP